MRVWVRVRVWVTKWGESVSAGVGQELHQYVAVGEEVTVSASVGDKVVERICGCDGVGEDIIVI